jgi:Ca2+-transporting ATPase
MRVAVGTEAALREAQTMAVTTVVFFQAFYMLNCRSLRASVLRIGLLSNPIVLPGLLALAASQALLIWTPFLNQVFRTLPLEAADIALSALVATPILVVIGIEKWVERRKES